MSKRKSRRKSKNKRSGNFIATVFVLIIALLLITPFATKLIEENTHPMKYSDYISTYCKEYNVPKDLIYATIKVESSFNPSAESEVGALGLTQIMPDTFEWLLSKTGESYSAEDLKKPEISIKYCVFFYSILFENFSETETAVAAYHAGMNQVKDWLNNPEYSSDGKTLKKIPSRATAHYVNKVTNAMDIYNTHYKEELKK